MTERRQEKILGGLMIILGGMIIFNGVHYPQYSIVSSTLIGLGYFVCGFLWLK